MNMALGDTTGLNKANVLTDIGGKYVINENPLPAETNADESFNLMGESVANAKIIKTTPVLNNYSQESANQSSGIPNDKGWSHAAKGTLVGVGTGAITGALLDKEHRAKKPS